MIDWEILQKYYFLVVEGRKVGNGKSLLGCFLAHYYRLAVGVNIASNMTFNFLQYTHVYTEEQLFKIQDSLILLDEMDLNAWYESRQDAKVYYQKLMKYVRKNNNVIVFITQDVSLIPKKMRNLVSLICYPHIAHRSDTNEIIEFMGKSYKTDITPESYIEAQLFHYQDDICRPYTNLHRLIPFGEQIKVFNLYWYFDKYNTFERVEPLEQIVIEERKRKIKKEGKEQE